MGRYSGSHRRPGSASWLACARGTLVPRSPGRPRCRGMSACAYPVPLVYSWVHNVGGEVPAMAGSESPFTDRRRLRSEKLLSLARASRQAGWWRAYADVAPGLLLELMDYEHAASAISQFELTVVPGILQT